MLTGRCGSNFKSVISEHMLHRFINFFKFMSISSEIATEHIWL